MSAGKLLRRVIGGGGGALALLTLGACSTPEPVVSQAVTVAVPAAAPKVTGVDTPAERDHKQLVGMFGGEFHAPAAEKLLDEVLAKLAAASDVPTTPYKVTVLNSPVVNAFALPSGRLYLTRGLLALATDTAEVAAVMAHEIAHVTARHALARAEIEKRSALVSQAAAVIEDPGKSRTFQASAQSSLASFSRQQEFEADSIGVRTIARAGYDPYAAARFLQALARFSALKQSVFSKGGNRPDMTSTHPATEERVDRATAEARQIGAPGLGEVGRDRFLAALQNLPFGDDPAEGFVRGRVFVHPKLGFAFTAPDDFVLENSAQAVLGIANGGQDALRLDRVHVPTDQPLEKYLASGWIDNLQAGSVETMVIDGFPVATAVARGTEWSFRLAAIRQGSEVYRVIFATKALNDASDARFRASIASFRKIGADEAQAARPLRFDIETAEPGDTVDGFAARMRVPDGGRDLFVVLNGLEPDAVARPGERYKVVVDEAVATH